MRTRIHLAALAGVVVAAAAIIPAAAELPEKSKVTICHATGVEGHWVKQNVAVESILRNNGHAYHQGGRDIIPPFNPVGDLPPFAGLNWDDAGKAIWKNGCVVPVEPSPTPSESPTPEPSPSPSVSVTPEPSPEPSVEPSPSVTPDPEPTDPPEPTPTPTPTVTVTASPEPQPTVTVTAEPTFTPTASSTSTAPADPWADFDSDEILADVVREAESAYPWHEGNRHPSDVAPVASSTAQVPGLPSTGW